MANYKPVASPGEKFSGAEFESFLDYLDMTDADAARLLGVAEGTIKHCRKHGVTGFGFRFISTIQRFNLDVRKIASMHGASLTGLSRKKFQSQRANHNPISQASLVPSEFHQNMIMMYLREEGAGTKEQLELYFERKTGKQHLVAGLLTQMRDAGRVECSSGTWQIKAEIPKPPMDGGYQWEARKGAE